MRSRYMIWGAVTLAVAVLLVTLPSTHHRILPETACLSCHAAGILDQRVMGASADGYTGPDPCEPCHSTIYHIWTRSDHCRAMMHPGRTTVFSAFSPDTVTFGYRGFATRMVSGPEGYTMVAPGPDGTPRPYSIDLVLGIRDHQVFLTRFPDGRYQVLPSTYDMQKQTWFDATDGLIVSDHALTPGEPYYWTSRGRSWNRECFDCHLSGMRKNYDPETDTYHTTWRDLGIDCEACHGPGQEHARLRAIADSREPIGADTSLARLQDLTPQQQVEVCGQCHARKVKLAEGYRPGDDFYEYYDIGLLDDNLIMPDGRFWGMMYNMVGMMQSPCYERGGITCTHCHSGHGTPRRNDLLEFENDDQMCLPCHADYVREPGLHAHHEADGAGSRCGSCHIQLLTGSHMDLADHTFSIPVPENTVRFNSPNACNDCHSDRSPRWAIGWLDRWYGPDRIDRWSRAEVLFKAKNFDTAAVAPLIVMLQDTAQNMIWRATAAYMLGGFGDPRAIQPLMRFRNHPNPVLRRNVLESLTRFGHPGVQAELRRHILAEPNSQIRLDLAGKLGFWWRDDLSSAEQRIADDSWRQYVEQTTTVLADWGEARRGLAIAYMQRGEVGNAEREFTYALRIDSSDAASHDGLSGIHSGRQDWPGALAHARRAVELDSSSAHYRVNLAAVYTYMDSLPRAEQAYRSALRISPDMTPAAMNLAMLLERQGRTQEAHDLLRDVVRTSPRLGDAQYVLGILAMELSLRNEALQAFANALALSPPPNIAQEISRRLSAIQGPGERLPRPDVDVAAEPQPAPAPIGLDPREVWPIRQWEDRTPRTTPEDVTALAVPSDTDALLDSARAWISSSDSRVLRRDTRVAYGHKGLTAVDSALSGSPTPQQMVRAATIKGHGCAALASLVTAEEEEAALLAAGQAALDGVDTLVVRQMDGASAALGRAYYRLARAYDHVQNYEAAVRAFERAADLLPGTFAEAIAWFFVGTSQDRLGNRDEAVAAYARSAAHPNNSVRGVRCSVHGMQYPFRFLPPFKGF